MITMIAGKAGSGKTDRALQTLRELSSEKRVLYITNQVFSVTGEGAKFLNDVGLQIHVKITGILDNLSKIIEKVNPDVVIIDNITCLCKDLESTMKEIEIADSKEIDVYYTVQTDGDWNVDVKKLLRHDNEIRLSMKRKQNVK